MSLDVLLAEQHNAHISLCKKEMDAQIASAVKEVGPNGIQMLKDGKVNELSQQLLLQSDSAKQLLLELSGPVRRPSSSRLHAAGSDVLIQRQQKIEKAVQQKVAQEKEALSSQIRAEAAERRRLQGELRQLRAAERSQRAAPVLVKSCKGFQIDPNWEPKPLPPATKRAVLRVDSRSTGLTYFEMG
eukprot:TRINITY_DN66924_c0_g1_i1.p2 TRINITY_DN66924_c0_g1~~TRINITY_DN66924_c0_g1_i1.p2  ORF type:complete len:186 (-),score=57.82 TRINITY_DN66924_c0_g1_i1:75-632(-)